MLIHYYSLGLLDIVVLVLVVVLLFVTGETRVSVSVSKGDFARGVEESGREQRRIQGGEMKELAYNVYCSVFLLP